MNNYGKLQKIESICKEGLKNHCSDGLLIANLKVSPYDVKVILKGILGVIQNE